MARLCVYMQNVCTNYYACFQPVSIALETQRSPLPTKSTLALL